MDSLKLVLLAIVVGTVFINVSHAEPEIESTGSYLCTCPYSDILPHDMVFTYNYGSCRRSGPAIGTFYSDKTGEDCLHCAARTSAYVYQYKCVHQN
ncbi:MAG: hypothetical protein HQK53_04270 [Oligoflexia bacterium]|nr:hypothetical protein [Oligoflexia bacterium]